MNACEISNLHKERYQRETPSFSSSLLDTIYRSFDECSVEDFKLKKHGNFVPRERESLRRAIIIEKWLDTENRTRLSRKSQPYNSTSSSSGSSNGDKFPDEEGSKSRNFMSKAMKIYGDLKKQPISPGRRLTKFINSFFNSNHGKHETDLNGPFQKSRSTKDTMIRSCLDKPSSRSNSKRTVGFYHVAANIVDDDSSGTFGRKLVENKMSLNELKRQIAFEDENGNDEDDMSCSSSDLFELENIDAIGVGRSVFLEELPVYGTTSLRTNHASRCI